MKDEERLVEIQNELDKLKPEAEKYREKLYPIKNKVMELSNERRKILRQAMVGKYLLHVEGDSNGSYIEKYIHVISSKGEDKAMAEVFSFLKEPIEENKCPPSIFKTTGGHFKTNYEVDLEYIDPNMVGNNTSEVTREEFFNKKAILIEQLKSQIGNQKE
jgi:hypothetical protein